MTDELAGKVLEAYKTSPLLTGLLLLNIGLFIGMGWYIVQVQNNAREFVKDLQTEVIALAKTCNK
jgi:hypothetical protein